MIEAALTLSRLVHYLTLLFVFGGACFPLYAFSRRERRNDSRLTRSSWQVSFAACLVALASGAAWLLFATAIMADSLSDALSPAMMRMVLTETRFGIVWSIHLALIAALAVLIRRDRTHPAHAISIALLSAACLASLAGVGHTQTQDGADFLLHTMADGAHLLAAGAWLGGLIPLFALLTTYSRFDCPSGIAVARILSRFSGMGYLAVAVLLATGSINGWYLIGSVRQMAASLYGQLLIMKLAFFAGMLFLAVLNRLWLVPALRVTNNPQDNAKSLERLRSHIIAEQLLGLAIIALVGLLGTLAPPGEG